MNKYYVYCLYSETKDRLYIGHTDNLERRFNEHCEGKVRSTKPYRPYKMIYFEEQPDKACAMNREKQLKRSGRKYLRKLINIQ
ncbi:MAG: GIY-YIG nuclease family protein [Ignavibacteria bacterium]|nr:GIY-YIG nuclease family protein [Ignavibacteria bacterium]